MSREDDPRFIVLGADELGWDNWGFFRNNHHDALSLSLLRKEYPQVRFDGTYFVFSNPDTGKVAFLHPERPTEPILGWPKPEAPKVDRDAWPFGEPETRFAVSNGQVVDLEHPGKAYDIPENRAKRITALGPVTYLVEGEADGQLYVMAKRPEGEQAHFFSVWKNKLFWTADGKVVFETTRGNPMILDPAIGIPGFLFKASENVRDFRLTADGRYIVLRLGADPKNEKERLRFIDPVMKDTLHEIESYTLGNNSVLPSLPVPLVVIREAFDIEDKVYDVKNRKFITGYLATDPQGRFSVGQDPDGGLFVFSHVSGKRLTDSLFRRI
jgi:hypothetical protein